MLPHAPLIFSTAREALCSFKMAIGCSCVAEELLCSSAKNTDQSEQSRNGILWLQERQRRLLNLLITLSPTFHSSRSPILTAVCAAAPSCCSQKCRLVTPARTSDQVKVSRRSGNLLVHGRTLGPPMQHGLSPVGYWL